MKNKYPLTKIQIVLFVFMCSCFFVKAQEHIFELIPKNTEVVKLETYEAKIVTDIKNQNIIEIKTNNGKIENIDGTWWYKKAYHGTFSSIENEKIDFLINISYREEGRINNLTKSFSFISKQFYFIFTNQNDLYFKDIETTLTFSHNFNDSLAKNIKIKFVGADLIKAERNFFTIIPREDFIYADFFLNGTIFGRKVFSVYDIPTPEIQIFIGDSPYNIKQGVEIDEIDKLKVVLIKNKFLKNNVQFDFESWGETETFTKTEKTKPQEFYTFNSTIVSITPCRGRRPVMPSTAHDINKIDVSIFKNIIKPNDRILIEINNIVMQDQNGNKYQIIPDKSLEFVLNLN